MITTGFLYLVFSLVWAVTLPIRALSDVALPASFTAALVTAGEYLTSVEPYFPLGTLFIVLGWVLGVELAIVTYKGIMWLIRRLPTQS